MGKRMGKMSGLPANHHAINSLTKQSKAARAPNQTHSKYGGKQYTTSLSITIFSIDWQLRERTGERERGSRKQTIGNEFLKV